jgi:putative Mg2+ transporter-C (MgtC) family protein
MDWFPTLGKAVYEMVLGGIIGIEREAAQKPAGFRTNMLVGGASAFLVSLTRTLVSSMETSEIGESIRTDPIRIIEAIIVGISFIGAGTIIQRKSEERVENLTTAATILFVAALGVAVALNQIYLATSLAVVVILVNFALGRIETWVKERQK